jgi:hypothetical protein
MTEIGYVEFLQHSIPGTPCVSFIQGALGVGKVTRLDDQRLWGSTVRDRGGVCCERGNQ